jgi:hypothetical protein
MRAALSLILVCLVGSVSMAGTAAQFAKNDSAATIVVDNIKTPDADFLWNLLATPIDQTSKVFVRRASTSNDLLKIECQRDTRAVNQTTCLIEFTADDRFVVIGGKEKVAGITVMGDWGREFLKQFIPKPENQFAVSPDESILQCWGCSGALAELTWSPK